MAGKLPIAPYLLLAVFASCTSSPKTSALPTIAGSQSRPFADSRSSAAQDPPASLAVARDLGDEHNPDAKAAQNSYSADDKRIFEALSLAARRGAEAVSLPSTPQVGFPVSAAMQREYDALARRVLALELSEDHIDRLFPKKGRMPILSSRTPLTKSAFPKAFRRRLQLVTPEELGDFAATSETRVAVVILEFAIDSDEVWVSFVAEYFGADCTCRSTKRWSKTAKGWRLAPYSAKLVACG